MAPAPGRTNDQYFRGHHIDKIAQKTSWRYPWSTADRLFFSKHAARYQITDRSNVSLGLDEVARKLGISDRSDYYKNAVLGRAKAAILYLVQHKFRGGETRILVETGETVRGEAVWKWPQYSLRWLKPDWDGNIWPLNGDDRKSTRRDTPGVRAGTPEPNRRAGPYVSGGRGPGTRSESSYRYTVSESDVDDNSTYVYSTPSPSTRRARAFSPTPGPDERSWTRSGSYLDHDSDDGGTGIYHDSDDDEAHFSDSSTRTMRPSRVFQKRHKRGGQEAEAEASITSFVKQELQEQQTKLDNKFNAMIDVVKDLCTMSRGKDRAASEQEKAKKRLDDLPPPPTEDPMPYMPTPPSTPPSSYRRPSFYVPQDSPPRKPASARDVRWWFPDVPDEVANLDPWHHRLRPPPRTCPPPEASYQIPTTPGGPVPKSRELLAEALKYATVEIQHNFQAAVAGIAGNAHEAFEQQCGARFARTKRDEFAQRALEAGMDEMGGDEGASGGGEGRARAPAI
ncbi:hypothetical protein FDECE_2168, partial [Fusarium decemcellulare]